MLGDLPAEGAPLRLPPRRAEADVGADVNGFVSDAAPVESEPDVAFSRGYRAEGGPDELLAHFLDVVLPCEGGADWRPDHGNGYVSRAQFHRGTWQTITAALGVLDAGKPYDVGRAVAWWINAIGIEAVGTNAGWPWCFNQAA